MKILKLKFSNLNSLAGTWDIDFTDPTFTSSGIFVITGPTGSGKTTVLDAICLALYGRTPRLDKVTKTSNHIMTRHTGGCSAEVVFESQKGRFICHWSQRRARNRPEGELQSPQHEISRADTGEILASKINQVREIVEEVTGMNYDQFTRSILLAQGGFAAFLQAGADERAPILEQITGTDIYSRLSIKVHERYSIEREKLDQINRECDLIPILSPEEKENIEQQIQEFQKTVAEKDGEIARNTGAVRWIETVEKLRGEVEGFETDIRHIEEKKAAFEPSRQALLSARKAASLQRLYTPLELKRETLQKDVGQQEQTVRDRDLLLASLPDFESSVLIAKTAMEQAEREREDGNRLIQSIRLLDKEISEKGAEVFENKEELKKLQDVLAEYKGDQEGVEKKQQAIVKEKSDAARYIDQNAGDAAIRDMYSGIEQKANQICQELDTIREKETECIGQKKVLLKKEQETADFKKKLEIQKKALQELEDQQKNHEKELEKLISGTTLSDLRQSRDENRIKVDHLNRLSDILAEIRKVSAKKEEFALKLDDLTHYLQTSGYERECIESDIRQHEELLAAKRTAAFFATKVRDLTTERSQLINGEPCPLCGSIHHPFVTGKEIEPDEIISDFVEQEKKIRDFTLQLTTLTAIIAEKRSEFIRCNKDITEYETKLNKLHLEWREGADAQGINPETDDTSFESYKKAATSEFGVLETTLRSAEQYDEIIRKSALRINSDRATVTSLEKTYSEKDFEITSGQREIEQQREHINSSDKRVTNSFNELKPILANIGCSIDRETNITAFLLTLKNRQKKYQEQEDRVKICDEQLREVDKQISGLLGQISEKNDEIARKNEAIKVKEISLLALKDERIQKFGEKDTENEEKRLTEEIKKASEILGTKEKAKTEVFTQLESLKSLNLDLEKRITATQNDIRVDLEEFLLQIRQAGFADEETYKSALMKQEEISRLEKIWEDIRTEETRICERRTSAQIRFEEEQKKNLTTKPAQELKEELESYQELKDRCIANIGKNQEKIFQHENQTRLLGEKIAIRDTRRREVDKWRRLYELIGSADGKKFRVFAQGLTFCILLSHANQHLKRMTDRYILIQDKELPLDMQVIDTWQGGVSRSVKNLSGGEIFMVSLALALGLSGMASQNVRVDSLFLDEGFGTLDDEALETALCTLSGLEQEGKLIGVISHVPALKERIPVRILIEKGTSGRSKIILPNIS